MLRLFRSPAIKRRLLSRGIAQTRVKLGVQTVRAPMTSLNSAAAAAHLDLGGSLDELASGSFSEASVFPEFTPAEDTLLQQTQPKMKTKPLVMDAHALAEEELAAELESFCEASDFPEYSSVEEVIELHKHAIPVTQNEKVVGVFTEHDYFEKVLNTQHPALRSSRVCQVAAVGPNAAVVHMDDTVEDCLAVMAKKNLTALPVTTRQGQVVGTISLLDLTRELMTPTGFSEPSDFPETTATASPFAFSSHRKARLFHQLKHDLDKQASLTATVGATERLNLRDSLEDLAADSFSEASVFPEFTPAEDALFTHTQPKPELRAMAMMDPHGLAEDQLAGEMEANFCEASDFPECSSVEEAIQLHNK
ncbi:hypothetical protein BBJ28_00012356 [Nothophytophthora sp. Chile5]|nr:hypothetical protein BBJ28_00012356 [Nothophytophthora sp. Chile5]